VFLDNEYPLAVRHPLAIIIGGYLASRKAEDYPSVKGSRHPPDRWSATSVILTWTSLGRFASERNLVGQVAKARHLYLYLVFDFSRRYVDRPSRWWIRPRPQRSTARSTLRCLDPLRGFHETPVALDLIGEKRATLIDVFPAEFACWTSCSERTAALFERALSFGFRPNPCEKSANPIISLLLPRGISTRITPSDSRCVHHPRKIWKTWNSSETFLV